VSASQSAMRRAQRLQQQNRQSPRVARSTARMVRLARRYFIPMETRANPARGRPDWFGSAGLGIKRFHELL